MKPWSRRPFGNVHLVLLPTNGEIQNYRLPVQDTAAKVEHSRVQVPKHEVLLRRSGLQPSILLVTELRPLGEVE